VGSVTAARREITLIGTTEDFMNYFSNFGRIRQRINA
jgi:hypothetical protein